MYFVYLNFFCRPCFLGSAWLGKPTTSGVPTLDLSESRYSPAVVSVWQHTPEPLLWWTFFRFGYVIFLRHNVSAVCRWTGKPQTAHHTDLTMLFVVAHVSIPHRMRERRCQVDAGMKLLLWVAGILLTVTCVLIFVLVLDAEAFQDQSLAVLNAFLAYPAVAYSVFSVYQVPRSRRRFFCCCSG